MATSRKTPARSRSHGDISARLTPFAREELRSSLVSFAPPSLTRTSPRGVAVTTTRTRAGDPFQSTQTTPLPHPPQQATSSPTDCALRFAPVFIPRADASGGRVTARHRDGKPTSRRARIPVIHRKAR
ncbi:hypothetical protein [Haladaptatus halobius]|uniref:hypothetical protein n=1 Tax=Haladaptatus halobius TaxID=2884875 RepID=UPI001D09D879|nr:hypothetical protein [Haladaptatus halobius]